MKTARSGAVRSSRAFLTVLALIVAGCSPETSQQPDHPDAPRDALPRELTATEQRIVGGANAFTFDLLGRVASADSSPNIVLSPLSATMALGMVLNGTNGQTRAEMEQALRMEGLDADEINAAYRDLIALLSDLDDDVTFELANAIWAREGIPFERDFTDAATTFFDATVRTLDFADPATVAVINGWVSDRTRGRIEKVLEKIDPMAVMFLANAIYFKGDWTRPFDPERTRPAPFRRDDGSTVQVQMMDMDEARHSFAYRPDGTTVLDLAYGDGAWAMTLVQPPEGQRAAEYAASLDAAEWDTLVAALDTVDRVMVRMPRFTLRYERKLNDDLQALGMQRAFTDAAEFRPLTPEDVYLHEVKQITFIAVDEVGTEAAAVTTAEIRLESMPPHMFLDRPFIFAIRERLSGAILFVGVVGDPTAT